MKSLIKSLLVGMKEMLKDLGRMNKELISCFNKLTDAIVSINMSLQEMTKQKNKE